MRGKEENMKGFCQANEYSNYIITIIIIIN